ILDWVSLLLRTGYYYGHIIGVSNFEIDWRTGRVFRSTRSTVYAIAGNVLILMLISFKVVGKATFTVHFEGTHQLYNYVVFSVTLLRNTAGLVTLYNQWRYQSQIMLLVKTTLRRCRDNPEVIRMSRWRILLMFCIGIVTDNFRVAFPLGTKNQADTNVFLGVVLHFWLSAILNLLLAQHYIVMLCIRGQYNMLNAKLKQVIKESKHLSLNPSRKGAFMTKCCTLADQLEDIAKVQDHLQSIVTQLDRVFGIQFVMVISGNYVSTVATIYTTYRVFRQDLKDLRVNMRGLILSFTWCLCSYMTGFLDLIMALRIQDDHKEMIRLLEERTLFAPGLDVRLEQSFESLQLQLIRNPLKMNVLQLFQVNRQLIWATTGSIILHSISLIQYDFENF
ncbi:hypothetical protein KR059_002373, partial [Drosophila kikkawai]